jgi:hypothetical protein
MAFARSAQEHKTKAAKLSGKMLWPNPQFQEDSLTYTVKIFAKVIC